MGFTGLARWTNAPATGLQLIGENITKNHNGVSTGRWYLTIKCYRSSLGTVPGLGIPAERALQAVTMNDCTFVLIEDPVQPTREAYSTYQAQREATQPPQPYDPLAGPSHYRTTYVTVKPPGGLDQLLSHLRARWQGIRQAGPGSSQRGTTTVPQVTIDGYSWRIGNEWIVRAGNVTLAGGAAKGMLIEAEYLPLPNLHTDSMGTPPLFSDLLTSVLPIVGDARTHGIVISDAQWDEVLYDREKEDRELRGEQTEKTEDIIDDIYVAEDEWSEVPQYRSGDWVGIERDLRAAFLILGALKAESLV